MRLTEKFHTASRGARRGVVRAAVLAVAAAAGVLVPGGPAHAAPACAATGPAAPPVQVAHLPDWVESIAVDRRGRMFATAYFTGRVYRIDAPGSAPVALTGDIGANGGIVVRPDGRLLVGTGNDLVHSLTGDVLPVSKLLAVDPESGEVTTYASGLGGIDGVALAPDGTVYTTTLGGRSIGRVTPDGRVDPAWAKVAQPNGIAVSPDGSEVYVVQTTVAPGLYRIPVGDPAHPRRWISAGASDALALPDGLTLDGRGRPLIATHASGQIWRAEGGSLCALESGMRLSTQLTYGQGDRGFSAGRLYRAGVDGRIYEVPAGAEPVGERTESARSAGSAGNKAG
ncbi:SMP-30/gluconolactonase/LRE family protein [Streptomyces sp. NBC_01408]|uniref:SMP-30/gluconolactonase/LRE family protein n=1 Tax=Streptomyces sp. NBC_01408 TaxID=2903855 RepID=UPI00225AF3C0|nr:SMP-30/gluconolactonase/LRE family protein [Streptomyces sp. NBC_01408]MCX4694734.1 SMP-30/gluconolactonase/LRE family protein [Streptomyces sp. NBC_01408]